MNKKPYTTFFRLSLLPVLSITLLGCGGGSGETENTTSITESQTTEHTLYYAQDILRISSLDESFHVDLSNSMESSDGSPVALNSVIPLNDDSNCNITSLDENGFTIPARSVQVCDYRYRVGAAMSSKSRSMKNSDVQKATTHTTTSGDGFAEGTVRTAVGESVQQLLPISGVTSSFTAVTINIPTELNNLGYTLNTDAFTLSATVTLLNGNTTNSTAIANSSMNTIEYTPGSGIASGVERILYTYHDGTNVLSGTIDIAVSTNTNSAPTAESKRKTSYIDPDSGNTLSKIPYGKLIRFDVADLISDPDGDTLHLVDVYAFGATLIIPQDANGDGNAFNDTEFDFSSKQPGEVTLTYVVSDEKGGYATGIVQSYVSDPYESIFVSSNGKIYLPPTLYQDAQDASIASTPKIGNGTTSLLGITTATHNWEAANYLCQAKGARLPSVSELRALYNEGNANGALFINHNWPVDVNYWTSEQGSTSISYHQSLDMENNTVNSDHVNSSTLYAACIDETPPGYPIIFFGDEDGDEYLFDIRINEEIVFGCGWIVDSISQVGGAYIGGNGGDKHSVNVADVGKISALWGYTGIGQGNDLSRLYLYNRSGDLMFQCGNYDYSNQQSDEYILTEDETLTGFRVLGDDYINGLELWIDTVP